MLLHLRVHSFFYSSSACHLFFIIISLFLSIDVWVSSFLLRLNIQSSRAASSRRDTWPVQCLIGRQQTTSMIRTVNGMKNQLKRTILYAQQWTEWQHKYTQNICEHQVRVHTKSAEHVTSIFRYVLRFRVYKNELNNLYQYFKFILEIKMR